ncbi:MAG: aspartate 1-decarboxylase [Nitrospirae bacterium]|nr:aspartate 1-decarboxylase [Nitrospirota bacterium]
MLRCILRAKIHGAVVTDANLQYEGSITIDTDILKIADIMPYEQVSVSNLNNGERFETYAIPGKKGEICLNGPTARKGAKGDIVIIFSYCYTNETKLKGFKPKIIRLNSKNKVIS